MKNTILSVCLGALVSFGHDARAGCEAVDFDQESIELLTAAERKARLDEIRIRELSRDDACEDTSGSGSGSGSGSQSLGINTPNAADGRPLESRSSNLLGAGESSIAISSHGQVIKAILDAGDRGSLSQGADHEALTAVDNVEEMKAQIKAAADAETDPVVREKLMQKYKELSKQ